MKGPASLLRAGLIRLLAAGRRRLLLLGGFLTGLRTLYSGGTASAPSSSERVRLSAEQRALIRKHATEKKVVHRREARRNRMIKYELGEELPSDLDYYDMPEVVLYGSTVGQVLSLRRS